MSVNTFNEILDYWFVDLTENEFRPHWFAKDPEIDRHIRKKFEGSYKLAHEGQLESWMEKAESALALVVLLDQFPRNMYRGRPEAFASDSRALKYAKDSVAKNFDKAVLPVQRFFFYLPYEHSENLADQNESVRLFKELDKELSSREPLEYAIRHLEIIKRFGRFPHRNAVLGRPSTPEELEFLKTFEGF